MDKRVVRIVDRPTGDYCLSNNSLPYIDERGAGYTTRRQAITAARAAGYTHYITPSGKVKKLYPLYRKNKSVRIWG